MGYVTDAALEAILRKLGEQGCLSTHQGLSRRSIARSVKSEVRKDTFYGKPTQTIDLPLVGGTTYQWSYVHPAAFLNLLASCSPGFANTLTQLLGQNRRTFDHPWHIIFYADEAAPGKLPKVDNARKRILMYWSFEELVQELLSRESNWFLAGCIKSKVCSQVPGGLSCIFNQLAQVYFSDTFNFELTGATIHTSTAGALTCFAKLGTVIGDEAALKQLWSANSAMAIKPCMLCKNVVGSRSGVTGLGDEGYLVDISCDQVRQFDCHDDATLWGCADRRRLLATWAGLNLQSWKGQWVSTTTLMRCCAAKLRGSL